MEKTIEKREQFKFMLHEMHFRDGVFICRIIPFVKVICDLSNQIIKRSFLVKKCQIYI